MDPATGLIGDDSEICGNRSCSFNEKCVKGLDNPNFGATGYDDIFMSLLTTFQAITLEGWTHIMIDIQKAFSSYVSIYYIFMIFTGAFFFVNLTLAVIKMKFTKMRDIMEEPEEVEAEPEIKA